jgi:hypothetical protein
MLEPGTVVRRVRDRRRDGTGGMGTVLRVRDTSGTVTLTKN